LTTQLREGITAKRPKVCFEGEVDFDEIYVVAVHKGNPKEVQKKNRKGRRNRLKGARGRGTLKKEKPPVFGIVQRNGVLFISMLQNVHQNVIGPIIKALVKPGTNTTFMTA
jgi:hypothetical protein